MVQYDCNGDKKEEYREIKPYWTKRLFNNLSDNFEPKSFDKIVFRNGYSKNSPIMVVQCLGIDKSEGTIEWGAREGVEY